MAAGNPLALLELPLVVDSPMLDEGAPLPVALERGFAGHLKRLTPQAQALLFTAAVQTVERQRTSGASPRHSPGQAFPRRC